MREARARRGALGHGDLRGRPRQTAVLADRVLRRQAGIPRIPCERATQADTTGTQPLRMTHPTMATGEWTKAGLAGVASPNEMAAHIVDGGSPLDLVEPPDWFSFSSFDSYARCPRQYAFRYLCHLPADQPRPAVEFGTAAHGAFETFTRERRVRLIQGKPAPSRAELGRFFDDAWSKTALAVQTDAETWRHRASPMLDSFWEAESADPAQTLGEELRFRLHFVDVDKAFTVTGYIDRVDRLLSGCVEVIDYKSGAATFQGAAESNLQLSIYALACRDALGLGRPELVTLYSVQPVRRSSSVRSDASLDTLRADLVALVRRIRGGEFTPTPSGHACGWCDFKAMCPASVRPASASS